MLDFEGHAIVSADSMIAAADGTMPEALRNDADWRLFQAALDKAVLVVLGRLAHERHPNPGRRRLVVTSRVPTAETDPADPNATLWNPAGLSLSALLSQLGIATGTIAITGGTRVFDLFLPHYTRFALSEVPGLTLPNGRPSFTAGPPRTVLAAAGLEPAEPELIDPVAGIALTRWTRRS
jgi:dihydrofolate reductase